VLLSQDLNRSAGAPGGIPQPELDAAAGELSSILGQGVAPKLADVAASMSKARLKLGVESLADLIRAIGTEPTHFDTREAASHLALALGALEHAMKLPEGVHFQSGLQIAEDATSGPLHHAGSWAWLSVAQKGIAELSTRPGEKQSHLRAALHACEMAAHFDPWNPLHAVNGARLGALLGDPDAARSWAARALELDANMRLDPLRRLETSERLEMERLARPAKPRTP
jgi:hypothetical protein